MLHDNAHTLLMQVGQRFGHLSRASLKVIIRQRAVFFNYRRSIRLFHGPMVKVRVNGVFHILIKTVCLINAGA